MEEINYLIENRELIKKINSKKISTLEDVCLLVGLYLFIPLFVGFIFILLSKNIWDILYGFSFIPLVYFIYDHIIQKLKLRYKNEIKNIAKKEIIYSNEKIIEMIINNAVKELNDNKDFEEKFDKYIYDKIEDYIMNKIVFISSESVQEERFNEIQILIDKLPNKLKENVKHLIDNSDYIQKYVIKEKKIEIIKI